MSIANSASGASQISSFSMDGEDFGLTDMTASEFEAFKSNDTHTTTGETHFSAAASAASSRSSKDSKKSKKSKKKKSSKKDRKETDDGTGAPVGPSDNQSDALFEKMLDAMGGDFTHSEFGDFADINAEADCEQQDLDWDAADLQDTQDTMSKKSTRSGRSGRSTQSGRSGRSGNMSTKTPATNSTGFTRNTGFSHAPGPTANVQLTFEDIQFSDENLFDPAFENQAQQQQPENPFQDGDGDDDSILSEISGLTGVFSGVQNAVYDDEGDEGYLPEILPSQIHAQQKMEPHYASPLSTSDADKQNAPKQLRFSNVSIRYYDRILTLNPSTIQGPSIGIGWRFASERTDDIDYYETNRGPQRPSGQLVLNRDQRETLLLELGYTQKQLAAGVRDNTKGRNQRRQTVQNLKSEKVEEALQGAGKRVKRMLNPFKRKE